MTHFPPMLRSRRAWNVRPLAIAVVVLAMVLSAVPAGGSTDDRATPVAEPPEAVWSEMASLDAVVEVEPGAVEVLFINTSSNGLEPAGRVHDGG